MSFQSISQAKNAAREVLNKLPQGWEYEITNHKGFGGQSYDFNLYNDLLHLEMEKSSNLYFVSSTESAFDIDGISINVLGNEDPVEALKDFQKRLDSYVEKALDLKRNIFPE